MWCILSVAQPSPLPTSRAFLSPHRSTPQSGTASTLAAQRGGYLEGVYVLCGGELHAHVTRLCFSPSSLLGLSWVNNKSLILLFTHTHLFLSGIRPDDEDTGMEKLVLAFKVVTPDRGDSEAIQCGTYKNPQRWANHSPHLCLQIVFIRTQPCPFVQYCLQLTSRYSWQGWVIATEIIWTEKLEIFTTWPFKEKGLPTFGIHNYGIFKVDRELWKLRRGS